MTEPSISYRRLHNMHISGGRLDTCDKVVRHLGAMQAQDYHQALWAIGARTASATVADVEGMIEERKIVLTWPMRGTIHMAHPENVRWMLAHLAPRLLAQDGRRMAQLELNLEIIERCRRIFYDALQGNKRISRPELMQLLEDNGIDTKNQRGYHILWYLSLSGHICIGPREGKQQTFVLLDEWVPAAKALSRDEALALLAERYLAGHGPATVQDLAWWAGITLTDARQAVDSIRSRLVSERIDGQDYWTAGSAPARAVREEPSVYLLAGFDEYLLGYKDRSAVLNAAHAPHVTPGNNGVFMPTIVVDGQVSGIWKRTLKKKGIDFEFNLFAPQKDREARIVEAAERYCEFMGLPIGSTSFQLVHSEA